MQPGKEFIAIDECDIGLDRSAINHHGQIQLVKEHPQSRDGVAPSYQADEDAEDAHSHSSFHHIKNSINKRGHNTAAKLRKTFHISKSSDNEPDSESPILANAVTRKSDSRLISALALPDKRTLKDLVHDPVDTVKSKVSGLSNHKVAANIAAKEIPHGQEVDLLNARDIVKRAETDGEKLLAIQDLQKLMKERQNMFVRWTLDRHVTKVRILPRDTFVRKTRAEFKTRNAQGDIVMDWNAYGHHQLLFSAQQYGGQYIGYGSNPPPPSKECIMPNIERLIVASAPFQEFIMTIRRVYLWEDRTETTKYLLIYLTLWTLNLLLPGVLSAILYFVVQRYSHGNTLEDLHQDIKRTEDVHKTALTLTEFIEKRGDETWADELLEGLGPWLMVQLCDIANFFEVMRNFYEWRVPSRLANKQAVKPAQILFGRTIATLVLFVIAILFTTFVPVWLLFKSITLSAGFVFFGLFPIAGNFPEYRLLTSPAKWIFWNIPTHAEWSIKSLQAEGSRYRQEHATQPSSSPPAKVSQDAEEPQDSYYGFYTAHHNHTTDRLVISATSVRFVSNIGHKVHWMLPYDQINNLEKIDRIVEKNIAKPRSDSGKDLRFISKAEEERVLENVDLRDQAFSQIVGFSDTTWQVVW